MATDRAAGGDTSQRMFDLNRPQGYAKDDYLWQWKVAMDTVFDIGICLNMLRFVQTTIKTT